MKATTTPPTNSQLLHNRVSYPIVRRDLLGIGLYVTQKPATNENDPGLAGTFKTEEYYTIHRASTMEDRGLLY